MFRIIVRRLLISIPTLIGISLLAFLMIHWIPGDPVDLMVGDRGASPQVKAEIRQRLGLDKPLTEQYVLFLENAVTGDLGRSIASQRPVWNEFWDRFPATVELGICAMILAVIGGLPLGIIAALKRGRFWDYLLMSSAVVGYSMPIFWWGLILILFFSVHLGWTPVSGRMSVLYDIKHVTGFFLIDSWFSPDGYHAFLDVLSHLILPSIALATIPLAAIARMTRASLLEVLGEDYVRTAKAKGLGLRRVVVRHALRNAMIPIVTVIGLMVGTLLTGAILTETIFSWPGIGRWLVSSVEARDYPVIQGGVLLIAVVILTVNLLVDVVYHWINPLFREGS